MSPASHPDSRPKDLTPRPRRLRMMLLCGLLVICAAAVWVWWEPLQLRQLSSGPVEPLERYVAAHPESRPASLALGRRYLELGRAADASQHLNAWVARLPGDPDARILLARADLEENRPMEAYGHLNLVLQQLRPEDPEAHWWLGQVLERRGGVDAALEQYEAVLKRHPEDVRALVRLGDLSRALRRLTAAEEYYGRALKVEPRNQAALTGLAEVLFRLGRASEALPLARQAVEEVSTDPRANLWLARALQASAAPGDAAAAEAAYRKALVPPTAVEARYHLALLLRDLGRIPEAADLLEENARANPLHRASFYELAACARRLRQPERAERATRRFRQLQLVDSQTGELEGRLTIEPDNRALRLKLAALYVKYGRPDLARPQVERLLRENPKHRQALRLQAQIAAEPEPSL